LSETDRRIVDANREDWVVLKMARNRKRDTARPDSDARDVKDVRDSDDRIALRGDYLD
jgi:hypothetical protein